MPKQKQRSNYAARRQRRVAAYMRVKRLQEVQDLFPYAVELPFDGTIPVGGFVIHVPYADLERINEIPGWAKSGTKADKLLEAKRWAVEHYGLPLEYDEGTMVITNEAGQWMYDLVNFRFRSDKDAALFKMFFME